MRLQTTIYALFYEMLRLNRAQAYYPWFLSPGAVTLKYKTITFGFKRYNII